MDNFYKNHQNSAKNECVLGANEAQIEQAKEQGRSMVEMLGVLAVVGVLSIGAISGYRYAMNKYRANQVTNELNLLSHQVGIAMMSKSGLRGALKLGEPYDSGKLASSGYSFAAGCGESGNSDCANQSQYRFQVSGLSEDVCQELTHLAPYLQGISDFNGTCAAGENTLNFVFETEASTVGGSGANEEDPRSLCNDRGAYNASTGLCACDTGFGGLNCAINKSCSGKGTFDETTQKCVCETPRFGPSCEVDWMCSGHGSFYYGACRCDSGYGGMNCDGSSDGSSDDVDNSCRPSDGCDNGDKIVRIGNHEFVVSPKRSGYSAASAFCSNLGLHLVSKAMMDNLVQEKGNAVYGAFLAKGIRAGWTGTAYQTNYYVVNAAKQQLTDHCNPTDRCSLWAICTSE